VHSSEWSQIETLQTRQRELEAERDQLKAQIQDLSKPVRCEAKVPSVSQVSRHPSRVPNHSRVTPMAITKTTASKIDLEYIDGLNWMLTQDFRVASVTLNRAFTIPAGFITDFNSVPQVRCGTSCRRLTTVRLQSFTTTSIATTASHAPRLTRLIGSLWNCATRPRGR
jgi:hypothetical protein